MAGRSKGNMTSAIILAHQIEVMARQKKLEDLQYYLRPKSESREAGAAGWLAALRAFKAKQDSRKDRPAP